MRRVAIVGAGAAGLCAARNALLNKLTVVIFEKLDQIGGTWVFTENIGLDKNNLPIHSSMYHDMKTNLPKEIMPFPGFPFPEEHDSFIHHSRVLEYLEEYANHYDLLPLIRFETLVELVSPIAKDDFDQWKIVSRDLDTGLKKSEIFDCVFVCNGHYSNPMISAIEGADSFTGQIIHSHEYRNRKSFTNRTVICLGNGPSGIDISLEMSTVAKNVFLCHENEPLPSSLPSNLVQKRGLKRIIGNNIELLDGELVKNVDSIVFCTGYRFEFPFFNENIDLKVDQNRITPLFQHTVHIFYPRSLFFIGIVLKTIPFLTFEIQIRFAFSLFLGKMPTPNSKDMLDWEQRDFRRRTDELQLSCKYAHFLGSMQWSYFDNLANLAGFINPIPPVIKNIYDAVSVEQRRNLTLYKERRYRLLDGEKYCCI